MAIDGEYERRIELRESFVQEEIRGREARLRVLSSSLRTEERRAQAQQESFQQVLSKLRNAKGMKKPVDRLEESRQLVEKLRERKANLTLVRAGIQQLTNERHGVLTELSRDEQRLQKMTELRATLVQRREQGLADREQEEISELVSTARGAGEEEAGDSCVDVAPCSVSGAPPQEVLALHDDQARGSAAPLLDCDVSHQRGNQQHCPPEQQAAPSGESSGEPQPSSTAASTFAGQVQAFEQWQQLGKEGVRVQFSSPGGGSYEVSVVAREGQDLDIAIVPERGADARSLRRARQEIEQQLQHAGFHVRRLEVR